MHILIQVLSNYQGGGADVACSLYRCLHTGAVDSLVNIILAENGIELVAEGESHHQPFC